MAEAGVRIHQDMTRISSLGLGDVLRLYFTYRKIFYRTIALIREARPSAVIPIDSPAFNLRLAKKISKEFRILYYISPQIWAWGGNRIRLIREHIARMLVILPFELEIYRKAGIGCEFVGHPLLDELDLNADRESLRTRYDIADGSTAIGLLPGSRESEVRRILPVMLGTAKILREKIPNTEFFIRQSANVPKTLYDRLLVPYPGLSVRRPQNPENEFIRAMDFALVTSGTATLETALLGTPFFLVYKTAWSTYCLGRHLIRVPYLGLVNLLAKKSVVPEFIQNQARPETMAHEAETLIRNPGLYETMRKEFAQIREILGGAGASRRAAESVLNFLNSA